MIYPYFNTKLASNYSRASQIIRILSESWVHSEIFCPSCGNVIQRFQHNTPVADFYCEKCTEQFELKSKNGCIGKKIVDGAYHTIIERLSSNTNPNLFVLSYDKDSYRVTNFLLIPKHYFIPEIIERRKPLTATARRAGWIGCNITLSGIPEAGKIFYIKNGGVVSKQTVLETWNRTSFLKQQPRVAKRSWTIDVIKCIEAIQKEEFNLVDLYNFEAELQQKHRRNTHIRAKIRQQLQVLRDNGIIEFLGSGKYRYRK